MRTEQQSTEQTAQQIRALEEQARTEARHATDDIRRQVRNAIRGANEGTQDAVNAARVPGSIIVNAPRMPGTIIFPTDGDNPISVRVDGSGIHLTQNGTETIIPVRDVVPRGAVLMTYTLSAAFAFVIVGLPLARAFARRMDRRTATKGVTAELQTRLDAMDRNIDTVAVELERVSEGQRFTSKLLAERAPAAAIVSAARGEVVERARDA